MSSPSGTFHSLGHHAPAGFASRELRVFIPDGLTPGAETPALYVFDGQNAFSDAGAPHGGWQLDRALSTLSPATHAIPLVVSIPSTSERMTELCPYRDAREGFGGGGDALLSWLSSTLMPLTQRTFGLSPGPLHSVLGGTSMGGLLALYGHFLHPNHFGGALCLSPSFWPADSAPMRHLPQLPTPAISRVYLDCGGREAEGRMIALVSKLAEQFATRGYSPEQFRYVAAPEADHLESEWAKRLPPALSFMFARNAR